MYKKIKFILAFYILSALPFPAGAATLRVGPDHIYKTPSQALKVAIDGDKILIDAGIYESDYAFIRKNNLTIEGNGGFAHLKSVKPIKNGKAIWVIKGNNTVIRNIEFSGARVRDRNGAGIRLEGGDLTLENCYFHHNQTNLLSGKLPLTTITIRKSEFSDITIFSGQSHNIYVGDTKEFILEDSKIHSAHVGHNVKSRARISTIRNNRIYDSPTQISSYLIDIPNGGMALIENNFLYQSEKAANHAMINYASKDIKYPVNKIVIKNNQIKNDSPHGSLLRNHTKLVPVLSGNKFSGKTPLNLANKTFLYRLKHRVYRIFGVQ